MNKQIVTENNILLARAGIILAALFSISPWASAPLALGLGILISLTLGNPDITKTRSLAPKLLSLAIVGLGAGMNLVIVAKVGLAGFGITFLSISATLLVGLFLGRLLGVDSKTSILLSVGTAICGGSAIAAIAPVIRAKAHSISVALAVVFSLNAVALLIFPMIGRYFQLSQDQFGMWSALAIHDTSSVVGAGLQFGAKALEIATTVKLARALWIVPLVFLFGFTKKDEGSVQKSKKPWFILGFLVMASVVTWLPALQPAGHWVEFFARKLLVFTLFVIGLNLSVESLKSVGIAPVVQGLMLWILVIFASFSWLYFGHIAIELPS